LCLLKFDKWYNNLLNGWLTIRRLFMAAVTGGSECPSLRDLDLDKWANQKLDILKTRQLASSPLNLRVEYLREIIENPELKYISQSTAKRLEGVITKLTIETNEMVARVFQEEAEKAGSNACLEFRPPEAVLLLNRIEGVFESKKMKAAEMEGLLEKEASPELVLNLAQKVTSAFKPGEKSPLKIPLSPEVCNACIRPIAHGLGLSKISYSLVLSERGPELEVVAHTPEFRTEIIKPEVVEVLVHHYYKSNGQEVEGRTYRIVEPAITRQIITGTASKVLDRLPLIDLVQRFSQNPRMEAKLLFLSLAEALKERLSAPVPSAPLASASAAVDAVAHELLEGERGVEEVKDELEIPVSHAAPNDEQFGVDFRAEGEEEAEPGAPLYQPAEKEKNIEEIIKELPDAPGGPSQPPMKPKERSVIED